MSTLSCSINQCVYHDGLLQIAITYDYALIDWVIVYDYHTHDRFLFSSLLHLSSVIITLTLGQVLIFFSLCHVSCSSFFLLFDSFSLIFCSFAFCWGFTCIFFINTYYTYFFKCTVNTTLDKCTWYLTEQNWGIVCTIQIMRYYTYLNVKYGYVNNNA